MVQKISDQVVLYLDDYTSIPHQINQVNLDAINLGLLKLKDFEKTGQYFWRQLKVFEVGYINFGSDNGGFIGVERLDDGSLLIHETPVTNPTTLYSYTINSKGNRLSETVESTAN